MQMSVYEMFSMCLAQKHQAAPWLSGRDGEILTQCRSSGTFQSVTSSHLPSTAWFLINTAFKMAPSLRFPDSLFCVLKNSRHKTYKRPCLCFCGRWKSLHSHGGSWFSVRLNGTSNNTTLKIQAFMGLGKGN